MNTLKVFAFALLVASAYARPQSFDNFEGITLEGDGNFDDATIQELAANDLYDLNPTYTYEYQVASDEEQTYIKHAESRDSDVVTGEYSYVDPLGSLITVKYTADADGYRETRTSEPGFVSITKKAPKPVVEVVQPVRVQPVRPAPARPVRPKPTPVVKEDNSEDLIAKIIAQLTPFIKNTVSTSLSSNKY
jgi:hypothetical protein